MQLTGLSGTSNSSISVELLADGTVVLHVYQFRVPLEMRVVKADGQKC